MSFSEFVKPYPNGYEDGESGNTPVTAAILNTNYDGFLLALNSWASEMETSLNQKADTSAVGQAISTISGRLVNMQDAINQKSTVSISDLLGTGTHIGTITVNGTDFALYAPSGGGGGSSVAWNQLQQTGTKIAEITIDGTDYDVYAPDPIDELSDLTDVSITNLQNGQILKWNATTSKWENSNESGGGGAGHTILDDDGTVLAQEDDLQFKGVYSTDNSEDGVTEVNVYREMTKAEFDLLSADEKKGFIRVTDEPDIVRIVDGVFIDTDNLILSGTLSNSGTTSYTATEDCYFIGYSSSGNALAYLVNNVTMIFAPTNQTHSLLLKKGQTLTIGEASTYSISYKIYGIQQGSNVVSSYSETILWSGTEVCNDANAHSLTLLDDYTNYDAIVILTTDSDNQKGTSTFLVSALELNQGYVDVWYPASNAGAYFILTGTKAISVYRISYANTLTYNKIIGIRY